MWGVLSVGDGEVGGFFSPSYSFFLSFGTMYSVLRMYVHAYGIAHLLWGIKLESLGKTVQVHVCKIHLERPYRCLTA